MPQIVLTKGFVTEVDEADYECLNQFKWCAHPGSNNLYAGRSARRGETPGTVLMHRQILQPPADMLVDHIDRNGLNNVRSNLRLATRLQNTWNYRTPQIVKTSKYKGVSWVKTDQKWRAQIRVNRHSKSLGYYADELSAALAYDRAAKHHFGEYACINFPDPQ